MSDGRQNAATYRVFCAHPDCSGERYVESERRAKDLAQYHEGRLRRQHAADYEKVQNDAE